MTSGAYDIGLEPIAIRARSCLSINMRKGRTRSSTWRVASTARLSGGASAGGVVKSQSHLDIANVVPMVYFVYARTAPPVHVSDKKEVRHSLGVKDEMGKMAGKNEIK